MAGATLSRTMRGKANRTIFLLAVVSGIISAVLVGMLLSSQKQSAEAPATRVPVVVAAKDIKAGTKIVGPMVTVKSIGKDVAVPSSFVNVDEAVGKVAMVDITAGEQITANRLRSVNEAGQVVGAGSLAQVVPLEKPAASCPIDKCGQRALSIEVAPITASGGLIQPGDQVDVLAAFKDGSAITVLQDLKVLAVNQKFEQAVELSASGQKPAGGERRAEDKTVATLAVWPEESQKLAAAEEFSKGMSINFRTPEIRNLFFPGVASGVDLTHDCKGSLRLVLRHVGQQGLVNLQPNGLCARIFAHLWTGQ